MRRSHKQRTYYEFYLSNEHDTFFTLSITMPVSEWNFEKYVYELTYGFAYCNVFKEGKRIAEFNYPIATKDDYDLTIKSAVETLYDYFPKDDKKVEEFAWTLKNHYSLERSL